jgi:glycosyltransferase involved in cell wall biosynthesis
MKVKNIIFYFPYRVGAGGVNILFLRLSEHLAETTGYQVFIADYRDGYMTTHKRNTKVRNLYVGAVERVAIPENSLVILQTCPLWDVEKSLDFKPETKFLFWNLHPHNLAWSFTPDRGQRPLSYRFLTLYAYSEVKHFLSVLLRKKGIVFMDGENLHGTEQLTGIKINTGEFVPVFAGDPLPPVSPHFERKFGWLGRLGDFKTSILQYTIRRIAAYALQRRYPTEFTVIGDGPDRDKIETFAEGCRNDFFSVRFLGEIRFDEIDAVLRENVKLLFAMGISALEAARMGIPAVLLDFSYGQIEADYVFRYLHETKEYTLGRAIGAWAYESNNKSLENMLDELPGNYAAVSKSCYEYYIKNHTVENTVAKLQNAIDTCECSYDDIKSFRNRFVLTAMNDALTYLGIVRRKLLQGLKEVYVGKKFI